MNTRVEAIFRRFAEHNPEPTTELVYHSPFELLIAVILSAQSTDKTVNQATKQLFRTANTPETILKLGEEGLKNYIKIIGLYNTKAKHIIKTCEILMSRHEAQIPDNRQTLESLPGVGPKTANVILNTVFGKPTIAVDTHLFRVCNRTQIALGKTPLSVEKKLLSVLPVQYQKQAHHWLVLHGRYICTARRPSCANCLIRDLCPYPTQEK